MTTQANGLHSPPVTEKTPSISSPPRVVLAGKTARILCVADVRGDYHELNRLIREHEATAVIHSGDFGFITADSLERMGDKILRHLIQYSPLLPTATRNQLLAIPAEGKREELIDALNNSSTHFPLSQFPHLLTGAITFPVPVFTTWGLIEDVRVLEKFRTKEYIVDNLTVLDEATTTLLETSGIRLRLLGLGGAISSSRFFTTGDGVATIAGSGGTMWTTALQMGELIETAQRTYDPSETRLFLTSAPIGCSGTLAILAEHLKADLTISSGLHFRYPSSFNHFAVHENYGSYRAKLEAARDEFLEVYATVKSQVDKSLKPPQDALLKKCLACMQSIPDQETSFWHSAWNWNLSDVTSGHLMFTVSEGRMSVETRSQGLSFAWRAHQGPAPPLAPLGSKASVKPATAASRSLANAVAKQPAPAQIPPTPSPLSSAPNNVKNILPRPPQSQSQLQQRAAAPPNKGPAGPAPPGISPAVSIPAKPSIQTRQPRGPPPHASTPSAPGREKVEGKSESTPAAAPGKTSTPGPSNAPAGKTSTPAPQVNGKSPAANTSASNTGKDRKGTATPTGPKKDGALPNGSTPNGTKEADKKEKESDGVNDAPKKEEQGEDKPTTFERKPRRPSLYIKGVPETATEDDLKALFPKDTKFLAVKLILHPGTTKPKEFAYIDFESDEDMQTALKNHTSNIGDKTVSVTISNPPPRIANYGGMRGSRGGSGFRGRGGTRASGSWLRKDGEGGSAGATTGGGEKKDN